MNTHLFILHEKNPLAIDASLSCGENMQSASVTLESVSGEVYFAA
jgi:hypothetical protein